MSDFEGTRRELRACADAGLQVAFWLRDDDFVAPSQRFRAMAEAVRGLKARGVLSAIPAKLGAGSMASVDSADFMVCQHGFSHESHAGPGEAKHEFGAARPLDAALAEIAAGRDIMRSRFAERFAPLFTPPWNKIGDAIAAALPSLGFKALSTHVGDTPPPVSGLAIVDTDLDILDWSQSGQGLVSMLATDALDARMAARLAEKRNEGRRSLVFGLLTHHRAMTDADWEGVRALVAMTRACDAVTWPDPSEIFGLAASAATDARDTGDGVEP